MRFSIRLMAVIVRNDSYDGNKKDGLKCRHIRLLELC